MISTGEWVDGCVTKHLHIYYTTQPSPVLYHYHCPLQMSSALHNYTTQPSPVLYHYHCCCFLQSLNQKWDLDKVTSLLQNDRNCYVQHKLVCSAKEITNRAFHICNVLL